MPTREEIEHAMEVLARLERAAPAHGESVDSQADQLRALLTLVKDLRERVERIEA